MRLRTAQLALAVSTVSLGAVIIAFAASGSPELKAELPGKSVRLSTSASSAPTPTVKTAATPGKSSKAASGKDTLATSEAATAPAVAARPFPRRIIIPSLSLDAEVVASGLKADGSMNVPASQAGWYLFGAKPGDTVGSAVIAGHIDREKAPGVFFDLPRLEIGEAIWVTDATGVSTGYKVTERYQVAKEQLPGTELFRTDGDPTLTLITCGGRFDSERRHYDDNIVIRAVPLTIV
jgi:LPXTG-site transpeptidase (sortase) family protein